ncbi:hypothetical protein SMKI_10G2980 [Saccharomyces mikatae IFO 1815]|uniref:triacylglycerol lipase n=1 Tax=Saccharomyces mikatae IFO 1815 TaxID=226126 RepID=A0AA35IQB1_SACMI|nr:uncharacterized protein SMKI_10G2980 [Saccharomyces mikatae IFO 1815]CAI4034505.1 hypothetical protein SMKI_10G2980 [Saccharomyces mikatae IFO 1815]
MISTRIFILYLFITLAPFINCSPNLSITPYIYERLVYFMKASSISSCISDNLLFVNKTLNNGGCPPHIKFCNDEEINPTAGQTVVELVLNAKKGELGSGYLAVDHGKKVVILAFRGSTTRQDWFSDFEIYPVEYSPLCVKEYRKLIEEGTIRECKGCKMHRGFLRFTETLGMDVFKKMESILESYPDYRIVVTGHSLGAALASLAGIELRIRGFDPLVLTFATPKIFNSEMRQWVDELFETDMIEKESIARKEIQFRKGYFRVVHTGDYIPMVPPFYHPAGLEMFINKVGLPQYAEDIEYRGKNNRLTLKDGFRDGMSGLVEDWLHVYEHRAYFIDVKGCSGL